VKEIKAGKGNIPPPPMFPPPGQFGIGNAYPVIEHKKKPDTT